MSEQLDSEFEEVEENQSEDAQFEENLESEELETDEYEEYEEDEQEDEIDEEISTAEVDRVLETLTKMMEEVESDSVHAFLEEAYHGVFQLVYEEEESDDDMETPEAHSEAA